MDPIKRQSLTDPATGDPLPPRDQPGFYPGFSALSQKAYWDEATRRLILERLAKKPAIRFFSTAEAETMRAVVDRVIPQDDRSEASRIEILSGIDERLFENRTDGYRYVDMPSDQQAYHTAARAFEEMAQTLHGQPFHQLGTLSQEQILQSIHDGKPEAAEDLWKTLNVERFWSMLLSDCAAVYYAHPWAWDEIGFGGPAYPRGYMRLEEGEPEPWEANEQRYEWAAPADTISDQQKPPADDDQTQQGQGGTH